MEDVEHRSNPSAMELLDSWLERGGLPDRFNVDHEPHCLLEHVSLEKWKRRLLSKHMTLWPLKYISEILEDRFISARIPLLQERLKLLTLYHILSTMICLIFNLSSLNHNEIYLFNDLSGLSSIHIAFILLQVILISFVMSYSIIVPQKKSIKCIEMIPHTMITIEYTLTEAVYLLLRYRQLHLPILSQVFLPYIGHCYTSLLFQSAFFPSRVCTMFPPHCIFGLTPIIISLTSTICKIGHSNIDRARWTVGPFFAFLFFSIRYQTELLERFESFRYLRTSLDTREERHRSSQPMTKAEQLITATKECRACIMEARYKKSFGPLDICEGILQQMTELVASSEQDLYKITREPNSPPATARDERFTRLYGSPLELDRRGRRVTLRLVDDRRSVESDHQKQILERIDSTESIAEEPPQIEDGWWVDQVPNEFVARLGIDMHLNFLTIGVQRPIVSIGKYLLQPYSSHIGVHDSVLLEFLQRMEDLYLPNPYHNSLHGIAVGHQALVLLRALGLNRECESFGVLEIFSFLISCIGHDAGHPGRTTTFLQKTNDPLNILYNAKSPLESMHAALVLSLLEGKGANVFFHVSPTDLPGVRRRIVELILATDMAYSNKISSRFRIQSSDPAFDPLTYTEDAWQLAIMCIKAADLGHSVLPLEQHTHWSFRVLEEFYQQHEEEQDLDIPVDGTFVRAAHATQFSNTQHIFLTLLAVPVWSSLYNLDKSDPIFNLCRESLEKNIRHWQKVQQNPSSFDYSLPEEISSITITGDAIMQPILDMEEDLVKRLRREGRTSLILPGERAQVATHTRTSRRRSEFAVGLPSGPISLKKDSVGREASGKFREQESLSSGTSNPARKALAGISLTDTTIEGST